MAGETDRTWNGSPGSRLASDRQRDPYVNRTGIPWEYRPHVFPPYKTVYDYYAKWEADGTTQQSTTCYATRPADYTVCLLSPLRPWSTHRA